MDEVFILMDKLAFLEQSTEMLHIAALNLDLISNMV